MLSNWNVSLNGPFLENGWFNETGWMKMFSIKYGKIINKNCLKESCLAVCTVTEALNGWAFSLKVMWISFASLINFVIDKRVPPPSVWTFLLPVSAGVGALGKLRGSLLAVQIPFHWLCLPWHVCKCTKQGGKNPPILLKAELVCWKNAHLQVRNCLSQLGQGN